jgi:hypothetical protein
LFNVTTKQKQMPKHSPSKGTHDDEIDLLELFRKIGKTLTNWFQAIGTGLLIIIVFLLRNILPLIFSIIIGAGLSYIAKWTAKPFYTSEITLKSNAVPNSEMIAYVNKINLFIKDKNYDGVATALSIPLNDAEKINYFEAFWVIDKNKDKTPDYVDYNNSHNVYDTIDIRMEDRFVIKVGLSDPKLLPAIRDGIISFVNGDRGFRQKNEFRLRTTDEMLARYNYDIKQLDSLQKVKYFEETRNKQPEKGGQMIFLQEQKTQLVYDDIYTLYDRKQKLEEEKDLYPGIITLVSDFYQPYKRQNGGFYYGVVTIPLCFGLTLLMLIYNRNRRKIRELFKKY